jgi:hypothetical protein
LLSPLLRLRCLQFPCHTQAPPPSLSFFAACTERKRRRGATTTTTTTKKKTRRRRIARCHGLADEVGSMVCGLTTTRGREEAEIEVEEEARSGGMPPLLS